MPKDAPDFSVGILDLSSIAINTMPILKNYPGGSVFYFDNFEGSNITWDIAKELNVDYGFAEIDKTHAYIGAGCARLYCNDGWPVIIRLDRRFQFRPSDTIGVEFSFMLSDKVGIEVELIYEYIIDITRYRFYITFEWDYIIVHTSEGDFSYPYNLNNTLENMVWNNVKVIINTKDHRFVRLYCGKDVFDIDHPSQVIPDVSIEAPLLRLGCYSGPGGDAQRSLWIDKVILTDDETI